MSCAVAGTDCVAKSDFRDHAGKKGGCFMWCDTQKGGEKLWRSQFRLLGRRAREDEVQCSYPQTAGGKTTAND